MGRGKIVIEKIDDPKTRMICFKKRRINLVKKCMQLSKMADCQIQFKIVNDEDKSLMLYNSHPDFDFDTKIKSSVEIDHFVQFHNKDFELCEKLEKMIIHSGNLSGKDKNNTTILDSLISQVEGFNMKQLFCLYDLKVFQRELQSEIEPSENQQIEKPKKRDEKFV